ncbi:proton-conducting membrane transporter [Clostridium estertheticum]|uniref:Proton-conducting membrane transporter n=1 Tax=Clostridium estertheticum TaxID=238834 RepID=A0A7Y3SXS2_9CLOT|nr:proton-conducting membrane transporter [Clostridium estertheticum]MBW9171864.1 proton-conducting membrane transporter [Clostridium estertheticum]NNU76968.1 proton-conducting membrane transporter [Clostridium estertheticum]WBL47941.1 proton-conducting membrane transporter [Clostridium estertheticum]WLC76029.1 proton-conducting membrane transporter [Clostridium estertheticum]
MKITDIINSLQELNFDLKYEVKNGNELYVRIKSDQIRKIVLICVDLYKFNYICEFTVVEKETTVNCVFSNSKQGYYVICSYVTDKEPIDLSNIIYQSKLFHREINKDYDYKIKEVSGTGAYQVAVGPVHAGIIEPGHFRFSVMGEPIENLEIKLMYKYRGIEKLCKDINANTLNLMFERVSGESSVAYGEAYAMLVEKLLGSDISIEIKAFRVVLLELERMYNYMDDLGGVGNDIGYSYVAKKFGYFSEVVHQLCERISGSRYMRNAIVPLGINIDFDEKKKKDVLDTLKSLKARVLSIIKMSANSVSFLDRVEDTGMVSRSMAKKLCMTGVVARACNLKYDVRVSFPYELYKEIKRDINIETKGGVFERYKLKARELKDAFGFIEKALSYINVDIRREKNEFYLKEGLEAITSVETVKGELVVYGLTGKDNKFDRIYFKTPSFTNWTGMSEAVLEEIIPDFPLINKSFNMSYSENDK